MVYDPAIPQAGDVLSQSQQDILDNFAQIGVLFGSNTSADHYAFDDSTNALRGLHKRVSMPVPEAVAPVPVSTEGFLYPFADPNDTAGRTQIYFKNNTDTVQLSNRFTDLSSSGYTWLPGGLIMMWGRQNSFAAVSGGQGVQPIDFPILAGYSGGGYVRGFPTNLFNIQIAMGRDDVADKRLSIKTGTGFPTTQGFSLLYDSALMNRVYWFAIGN